MPTPTEYFGWRFTPSFASVLVACICTTCFEYYGISAEQSTIALVSYGDLSVEIPGDENGATGKQLLHFSEPLCGPGKHHVAGGKWNHCIGERQSCLYQDIISTCSCEEGWEMQDGQCADIDECRQGRHNCTGVQTCENTEGGFRCRAKVATLTKVYSSSIWERPIDLLPREDGNFFVSDFPARMLTHLNVTDGSVSVIAGPEMLVRPVDLEYSSHQRRKIYIADTVGLAVRVMDPTSWQSMNISLPSIGSVGCVAQRPGGELIISDPKNNSVLAYNLNDGTIRTVIPTGFALGPVSCTAAPNGDTLVVLRDADRVIRISKQNDNVTTIMEGLDTPTDVAVSNNGDLLIADRGNSTIALVTGWDEPERKFPLTYHDKEFVVALVNRSDGIDARAVAMDPAGDILVAHPPHSVVKRFRIS